MMDRYIWPEGMRSAFLFSVDVDAEAPWLWSHREGGLPDRLGALEQRRFGPREGLWRLTDMLEGFGVKGSFYVPSVVAELHPEILPRLHAMGHEIGLHGHLHELVAETSQDAFERALDRSLEVFHAQTGVVPTGFRSPAWEMTGAMIAALKTRGIRYDSSLMGHDHPYEIDGMTEIPVQWQIDDAIYFKFFGGRADKWPPSGAREVEQSWRDEFDAGRRYGQLFTLTVHPWISGRAQRVAMLERLLGHITTRGDVWTATAARIAEWHDAGPNRGRHAASSDLTALQQALDGGRP